MSEVSNVRRRTMINGETEVIYLLLLKCFLQQNQCLVGPKCIHRDTENRSVRHDLIRDGKRVPKIVTL